MSNKRKGPLEGLISKDRSSDNDDWWIEKAISGEDKKHSSSKIDSIYSTFEEIAQESNKEGLKRAAEINKMSDEEKKEIAFKAMKNSMENLTGTEFESNQPPDILRSKKKDKKKLDKSDLIIYLAVGLVSILFIYGMWSIL